MVVPLVVPRTRTARPSSRHSGRWSSSPSGTGGLLVDGHLLTRCRRQGEARRGHAGDRARCSARGRSRASVGTPCAGSGGGAAGHGVSCACRRTTWLVPRTTWLVPRETRRDRRKARSPHTLPPWPRSIDFVCSKARPGPVAGVRLGHRRPWCRFYRKGRGRSLGRCGFGIVMGVSIMVPPQLPAVDVRPVPADCGMDGDLSSAVSNALFRPRMCLPGGIRYSGPHFAIPMVLTGWCPVWRAHLTGERAGARRCHDRRVAERSTLLLGLASVGSVVLVVLVAMPFFDAAPVVSPAAVGATQLGGLSGRDHRNGEECWLRIGRFPPGGVDRRPRGGPGSMERARVFCFGASWAQHRPPACRARQV